MMNTRETFDIYVDYLIASFGAVTATNLSEITDKAVSHDKVTRSLSEPEFTSKDLWKSVKPLVRKIESEDAVLIFDDTIVEKAFTDENSIISWHFDHSKGRSVKGINFLSGLYCSQGVTVPVSYSIVEKNEKYIDKNGKTKRRSTITKNEMMRDMLLHCMRNDLVFKYVLMDIWFASADNMTIIKEDFGKDFVAPIKENRKIARSLEDKKKGKWVKPISIDLEPGSTVEVYLESIEFPLLLCKQVFKNDDGSVGIQYLVSSDLGLTYNSMTTIYKKRWKVEEYHKSLKSNTGIAKSPTKTKRTQSNHIFASLLAYVRLEKLKICEKTNHFAIKTKLYVGALKTAMNELCQIKQGLNDDKLVML